MSIEPFPQIGRNDDLNKVREALGELCQILDFLFTGGIDSLNIRRLTADKITTGTIDAGKVTISASNGAYSYTIDGTGITANNGTADTLHFDLATGQLTIVSALIKSANGYPQVILNSASTLIGAYQDANNHVDIVPSSGVAPGIVWTDAGSPRALLEAASFGILLAVFGSSISLQSGANLNLTVPGSLNINGNSGLTLTLLTVKDVIAGAPVYGTNTYTRGILTAIT